MRALVGAKILKNVERVTVRDRDRKQGAENHVRGQLRGLFLDLDRRAVGQPGQPDDCRLACRHHRGEHVAQPPALKARVNNAPLPFPRLAIGHKHPVAQQRVERTADDLGFREIIGALVQHDFDDLGLVDEIGAEKRHAEFGHPGAVEPFGLARKNIPAEQLDMLPERDMLGPRRRLWRGEFRALAHAALMVVNLLTGVSMRDGLGFRPA